MLQSINHLKKQDTHLELGIYFKGIKMSDIELKVEIKSLVKTSGYKETKGMLCSIVKIVSMRHREVSQKQILKVAKEIL